MTGYIPPPKPVNGYQPRYETELPPVLPFGGSNIIGSGAFIGAPIGQHQQLPEPWQAMTPTRPPDSGQVLNRGGFPERWLATALTTPPRPLMPTFPQNIDERLPSLSPLAIFALWMFWGHLLGGLVGFLIYLFSIS